MIPLLPCAFCSRRTMRPEKNRAFFSPAYEIGVREKMMEISRGNCHCVAGFCPP